MSKGEIREPATGNREEQATEQDRKPVTENQQLNKTGNGTGDDTNQVETRWKRLTITDSFGTY